MDFMSMLSTTIARPIHSTSIAWARPQTIAFLAVLLSVAGVTAILSTVLALWSLWTTDDLKSVGMVIPVVGLVLILRVWRTLDWEMNGTWWGAALLALTITIVRLREQSVLVFLITPQWSIYIPPHPLVVVSYASGAVLLFGGTALYRAAWFPIWLLWLVNPVPSIFSTFVDLPLQRISAYVARHFAMMLGQPLSPDQMRLMFTPEFGMFIAPGCNGIRGAVTMGLIALVVGYVYRFRFWTHVSVVAGAVLLGYVFNLARLCLLVLYYLVALQFHWLQNKATLGDYIIGACLFLLASCILFTMIRHLAARTRSTRALTVQTPQTSGSLNLKFAVMFLVVGFGCVRLAHAIDQRASMAIPGTDQNALKNFPSLLGTYTLSRSWNEYLPTGPLLFHWADYAPADDGPHVAIGLAPDIGSHETLVCHSTRGEYPFWHGQMTVATADSTIAFSGSVFNTGVTQSLDASTLCNGSRCGESSSDVMHMRFIYSRPEPSALISQDPERAIPILIRAEIMDSSLPADLARQRLSDSVRSFLSSVSLASLTRPYRHY
jgi:exosortase J